MASDGLSGRLAADDLETSPEMRREPDAARPVSRPEHGEWMTQTCAVEAGPGVAVEFSAQQLGGRPGEHSRERLNRESLRLGPLRLLRPCRLSLPPPQPREAASRQDPGHSRYQR